MASVDEKLLEKLREISDGVTVPAITTYSVPYSKSAHIYITEYPEDIGEFEKWDRQKVKPGFYMRYSGIPLRPPFDAMEGLTEEEVLDKLKEILERR